MRDAASRTATDTSRLQAFVAGEDRPGLSAGHAADDQSPVFVFSGQGPQWWAMGRELLEQELVFRAKIEECTGTSERSKGQASTRVRGEWAKATWANNAAKVV